MIKLICDNCDSEVRNVEVLYKDVEASVGYNMISKAVLSGSFQHNNSGFVDKIVYYCSICGVVEINKSLIRSLEDFKDFPYKLKKNKYGSLIITRLNKYEKKFGDLEHPS